MRIGILVDRTGTSVPTIRYYEQIGLLRPAIRQGGGQRTYDNEAAASNSSWPVARSASRSRRCALLSLTNDRSASCSEARDLALRQLVAVQRRLAELKTLETSIAALVSICNSTCAGGVATDCRIFEDLKCREAPNRRMV
jgi:hypothetical protein